MTRRSPQDKKALSYARDRRNDYGENDKSSRRNIRKNKRAAHRADRHREHDVLTAATGIRVDAVLADRVECRLLAVRSRHRASRWRKSPDTPLAAVVEYKLLRRAALGMADPVGVQQRIERIRRRRPQ